MGNQTAGHSQPGRRAASSDKRLALPVGQGEHLCPRGAPAPPAPARGVRPAGEGGHSVTGIFWGEIGGNTELQRNPVMGSRLPIGRAGHMPA